MDTTERDLRAAILAAPDDLAPRLVYADWLLERGDPRGEHIVLQCAEGQEDEVRELRRRALWQRHGATWLAEDLETTELDATRFEYRNGFLHTVQLRAPELVALGPQLARHPIHTLRVSALPAELPGLEHSPVLRTLRRLELVSRFDDGPALARLLSSPELSRLDSLVLDRAAGSTDEAAVWSALERCSRLADLVHLALGSIEIPAERARWLGRSLPALRTLSCVSGFTSTSLLALAGSASFCLQRLALRNEFGPPVGDAAVAEALAAPMVRELTALSLNSCRLGAAAAARLPTLACAATLTELDLGAQHDPAVVRALERCVFPALRALDLSANDLRDPELTVAQRFPSLESLSAAANPLSEAGARAIIEHAPQLRSLTLDYSPVGDAGVCAIATASSSRNLRALRLGYTGLGHAAIDAIVRGGQLEDLRELALDTDLSSRLSDADLARLADGPFGKLARLEVRPVTPVAARRYFGDGWIAVTPTCFERRLDLASRPVVNVRPDPSTVLNDLEGIGDPVAFDPSGSYTLGARVRHPEHGIGVVVHVEAVRLGVRYPKLGVVTAPLTPRSALPFDPARAYERGDVFVHPARGPGIVLLVEPERLCVRFSSGDPEMVARGRARPGLRDRVRRLFGRSRNAR
ncbi:MAG TPA: TIGR02996 domain-containing protein [Kofleriaceae bacterium]|nr:TIGR02996 domain-containing protein [Kofleriaceae bacterium]